MKTRRQSTKPRPIASALRSLLSLLVVLGLSLQMTPGIAQDAPPGAVVTTLAGLAGSSGSADGTGSAARFNIPRGVAVDSAGNVYVADSYNHTLRKVTSGGAVTTLAGLAGSSGSADGTGSAARFHTLSGVAVDRAGIVYVADIDNHTIRKVTPGGVVTTLAGLAGSPGSADGTGSAARFAYPWGLAVDSVGIVYVADTINHAIRRVTPGGVVTTLAGSLGSSGSADGTGSAARFNDPRSVAVDSAGNVYVADRVNQTIRKVTPGGVVTTLAGLGGSSGSADGAGSAARFSNPHGVTVDSPGNVYVADRGNHTIRKVTPGGVVTTLAGAAGSIGSADGPGSAARFSSPHGVAVDSAGNVYVADSYNHTIRTLIFNDYPSIRLTANLINLVAPAWVTLAAEAWDNDGEIAKVGFFQGLTKIGETTTYPYTFDLLIKDPGVYTFSAAAIDNQGAVSSSDPITITVYPAASRWVAYNDHYAGPGTHPHATTWNVFGTAGGAPGEEGPLRNIETGAPLNAYLSIMDLDATGETECGAPAPGTPAYDTFNGYIDFGSGGVNHAIVVNSGSYIVYLFTGLDPFRQYSLRATVVGGVPASADRWTLFRISGATSFNAMHTPNVLTSDAQSDLGPDEAAMNTGDNSAGDVIGWDNIVPGPDGSFIVACTQYLGQAPGNTPPGPEAYAPVALRLEEFGAGPYLEVTKPFEGQLIIGPTNIITAVRTISLLPVTKVIFLANGEFIGVTTVAPYSISWENPPFGPFALQAVAYDVEGYCATSAPVNMAVITPPTNTIPPTIYLQSPLAETAITNYLTNVQVVFSQPVSGVDARDLLINDVPATDVVGSGTNYLVAFAQPAYGNVRVRFAADHGITDFSWPMHLAFDENDPGATWTYNFVDKLGPTVVMKSPTAGAKVTNLVQVTVTFSEPVTGVNASDFLVNFVPAYAMTGSGTTYTFTFSQPGKSGLVFITWAANHGITDLAATPNTFNGANNMWVYYLDSRTILVQSNAPYHMLKGYAEASSPTNAWTQLGFDDSNWTVSDAPFYFGDSGYTNTTSWGTPLTDMNSNFSSLYLRKTFVVNNPALITNLLMHVQSDDGYVAWINGYEVRRYNVTSNDIPYNGCAITNVLETTNNAAGWLTNTLPNPQLYLQPGTNVLAVHAFNASLTNDDFGLNIQLYCYLPNTKVPLTIAHIGTTVTVSWPAAADGYELKITSRLGVSAPWQSVTDGITTQGGLKVYSFTPPPDAPVLFFCLEKQ